MQITKEQSVLMKGIAIIMIVFYHFQYDMFGGTFLNERGQGFFSWLSDSFFYAKDVPWAWTGFFMSLCFIGVNVFFVLSGYGLMKKYISNPSLKVKDMGGQIFKILIPYWLAHPIIHVLDWSLKTIQYKLGFIDYETGFLGMHSLSEYIQSMLVIPRWFGVENELIFDGTWWYIGVIVQFYLLFPFLLKFFRKYQPLHALSLCVAVSLIYRYVISLATYSSPIGINEADVFLFTMFPSRLAEFALGMYLALDAKSFESSQKISIGIPLVLFGFLTLGNVKTMFMSDLLFALGGIMLVYAAVQPIKGFSKKIFNWIGQKSYAIYLYHEPLMKIALKFIFPNWLS